MSQQTSHTPGPWTVDATVRLGSDGGKHAYVEVISKKSLFWIAKVQTFGDDSGEYANNARLIAAAPDLLAAAKLLIDNAEAEGWDRVRGTDEPRPGIAELRAAIAKAEGRS